MRIVTVRPVSRGAAYGVALARTSGNGLLPDRDCSIMVHATARDQKRKAGIPEDPDLLSSPGRRSECRHFDMETKGIELSVGEGQTALTDQLRSGYSSETPFLEFRNAEPVSDKLMF
jgi:hypothetical protein